MNSARKALPISIKVNFTGSKTPDDNLSFLKASAPCSETLGLKDCSLDTGYWLWNLELNARVYDDASNWTVFRTDQFRVTGLYVDDNINLQPFSCSFSNPNDGPSADYLQNPTGQKSIFAIDAPGSFHDVDPDDQCLEGASPVYSETVIFNFQVNLANKITHYHHKIYYFVKIVIGGPHQLDRTNSKADYGNVSLKF